MPRPPNEVYFNAAPVLTDLIHVDLDGKVTSPGVLAGVGQSKTIELDLFSEGPTLPFDVAAEESPFDGGQLEFAFDRSSGVNGDKLFLTVTVKQVGMYGYEAFFINSTLGGVTTQWMVAVAAQ